MKKINFKAVVAAFCVTACGVSTSAYAEDTSTAVVKFEGRVTVPTCKISVEGAQDNTVQLGSVPKSEFSATGHDTEAVGFSLRFDECVDPDGQVTGRVLITFTDDGVNDPATGTATGNRTEGVLNLTDGSDARGVGIRVQSRIKGGGYEDVFGTEKVAEKNFDEVGMDPDAAGPGKVLPMQAMMTSVTDNAGIRAGQVKGQMTVTTVYQ